MWVAEADNVLVVFAGAGLQACLERTQYEIRSALTAGLDERDAISVIQKALAISIDEIAPREDYYRTYGLFVVRSGRHVGFFENQGGSTGLSPVGHAAQCVGSGSSLGQYYLDSLYREAMPMKWARIVAAHLIGQAKKYSGGCGGDTHLLEIPHVGEPRFVDDQSDIRTYEQPLAQVESAMQLVLPDGSANDATLARRLQELKRAIEHVRQMAVAELSARSATHSRSIAQLSSSGDQEGQRDLEPPKRDY